MNEQKISWKRSDLKWRGKQAFKKNYWSAVLVSLVLAIVMATGGSGATTGSAGNVVSPDYGVTTYRLGTDINGVTSYVSHVFRSPLAVLFALLSASAVVAVALIGILFHFFVGNVLEVGGRDFYIENLYSVPGPGKLLSVFRSGNYGNIVKTMFLRDLYLVLWTLLFIIPGVVKSYEYKMIPYLLAEYPDMAVMDFEGNYLNGDLAACMGWNNVTYPRSYIDMDDKWDYKGEDYYWENQFDYIIIADINIGNYDTLPLYVGLLMKDDMVSAITFYNPTAG